MPAVKYKHVSDYPVVWPSCSTKGIHAIKALSRTEMYALTSETFKYLSLSRSGCGLNSTTRDTRQTARITDVPPSRQKMADTPCDNSRAGCTCHDFY